MYELPQEYAPKYNLFELDHHYMKTVTDFGRSNMVPCMAMLIDECRVFFATAYLAEARIYIDENPGKDICLDGYQHGPGDEKVFRGAEEKIRAELPEIIAEYIRSYIKTPDSTKSAPQPV